MDSTTLSRRSVISIATALALGSMLAPVATTMAQEATPGAAPSLLDGLGLPTLEVTLTSEGITAPTDIAAGPVLLVVHNQTEGPALIEVAQMPAGVTVEDWLALSDLEGALPEWTAEAVVAGGVETMPNGSGAIVINPVPGEWMLIVDAEAEVTMPSATLSVSGDAATADIVSAVDVEMGEYVFNFPDTMVAGPQIWHITNVHTLPHHVMALPVDRPYTAEEVTDGLMAGFSGTPVTEGFSFESSVVGPPTFSPVITAGQEIWIETNLQPGHYVALCFISDPGSDIPHIMQGMFDTFEVTGG